MVHVQCVFDVYGPCAVLDRLCIQGAMVAPRALHASFVCVCVCVKAWLVASALVWFLAGPLRPSVGA